MTNKEVAARLQSLAADLHGREPDTIDGIFECVDALLAERNAETEVRRDGKTVRKDRWEIGIRRIVALMWGNRHEFEVDDVVDAVAKLIPEPFDNGDDEGFLRSVLSPESAAPPAPAAEPREPLPDGQIANVAIEGGWQSHELPAFEAGARWAEEHHGITPKGST